MAHGGRRAHAGRPAGGKNPHTIAKEAAREFVRATITAELGRMLAAQIAH